MTGGGDLEFVAGQEVHRETTDFLTGVVGDGDGLGVLAFFASILSSQEAAGLSDPSQPCLNLATLTPHAACDTPPARCRTST